MVNAYRFLALLTASVLALAPYASAQDSPTDKAIIDQLASDPARYRKVFLDFQKAVRTHDAAAVAALVDYPIGVTIGGRKKIIKDAKAFAAQYDAIVTPAIAAAVENESYDDLFVNYQGVMLGDGEVWINGLCRDDACKSYDVKVVTIQPRSDDSPPPPPEQVAAGELVQPLKLFKNWIVGCDNLRNCTAIGMMNEEDLGAAYVKLVRGGGSTDEPSVEIRIDTDQEVKKPTVQLALDGSALASGSFKVEPDGDFAVATIEGEPAADFAASLRNAKVLEAAVIEGSKKVASLKIPLAGSAAALLYLDDAQKRVGTETALVDKGSKPASSVSPVPPMPTVAARKMTEAAAPLPPLPHGIKRPQDASCGASDDMVFHLSPTEMLWGVCVDQAAYNSDYEFWVVRDGKPKRAVFVLPGRKPDSDPSMLTSPSLSDDGLMLNALYEGRGYGDCGNSSNWVWNGETFKLIAYSEMTECRGVLPDDWPVLFKAERK